MLRLLPKPGAGQDPPKRQKRKRADALALSPEAIKNLRVALRNLRFAYGSWACVAQVMGVPEEGLVSAAGNRRKRPSPAYALLAARAAGLPVETILTGKMRPADRCPTCGAHAADRRKGGAT